MEQLDVFGLKISNFSKKELDTYITESIQNKKYTVLYGYSFGFLPFLKRYPDLYRITNSFDLLVTDGTQFKWFCSLFGFKIKTIMSIPDLTNYALEYANHHRLRVLLFGGKEEINKKANELLAIKYSRIKFLNGINGYYEPGEEAQIINMINSLSPDILLIGISSPVKERLAYKYRKILSASIVIPCGGMLDVYAGFTKQTPPLLKKLGLATPYRVFQEPTRLLRLNIWITYETLFKIIPLAVYYRFFLNKKKFNLINLYINRIN